MEKLSAFVFLLMSGWTHQLDDEPCQRYHVLDMHDGQRHVDYVPPDVSLHHYICDRHGISSNFWYRLFHDGVNYELANECLPLNSCGTQGPVWMIGNYPDQAGVTISNTLCSNYGTSTTGQCECHSSWSDGSKKVDVQLCEDGHGGNFYIHRFDEVPACDIGFCVKDHPNGVNEYTDILRCNEKNGDCTSVTVVLDEAITGIETAAVYCNFKDNNIQNYVAMSIWKTPTTAQCSVPTTEVGGENKRLHGLFSLHVIQTFSNGDPSVTKKIVDILIFDSTCQTCDEDTNTCVLRNGMCFVNGECCQGNICDLCEPPPPTSAPSTPTPEETSTPATTESTDTPSTTGSFIVATVTVPSDTATTSTTRTPIGSSASTTYKVTPIPARSDGNNPPILWIMLPIAVIIIVTLGCVVFLYWRRHSKKPDVSPGTDPPPPYECSNVAYGVGPHLYPNGIVASGGQAAQPEKVPLDNMIHQNTENEKQYLEAKEKMERAQQVLANCRQSFEEPYYCEIPDKQDNPAYGIPPPDVNAQQPPTLRDDTNPNPTSDGVYHSLACEKDEEHNYSSIDTTRPHALPNTYQAVPIPF